MSYLKRCRRILASDGEQKIVACHMPAAIRMGASRCQHTADVSHALPPRKICEMLSIVARNKQEITQASPVTPGDNRMTASRRSHDE